MLSGTLGLIFSTQTEPGPDLYASGRFIHRRLGLNGGGKNINDLRESYYRLGQIAAFYPKFYDPIRKEYDAIGFGFLSHKIPLRKDSKRLWRISIDPVFFDLVRHDGGYLGYDLLLYNRLSVKGRRLFEFVQKLLHRKSCTPKFEARYLAVNVMGCAPGQEQRKLNEQVREAARELVNEGVIVEFVCDKCEDGVFRAWFYRGEKYKEQRQASIASPTLADDPMYEPMREIGLSDGHIFNALKKHRRGLIEEWCDVALVGMEIGHRFTDSPGAFFNYYIGRAAKGDSALPDWYLNHKKDEELRAERERLKDVSFDGDSEFVSVEVAGEFSEYMRQNMSAYEQITESVLHAFGSNGRSLEQKSRDAAQIARGHLRRKFLRMKSGIREAILHREGEPPWNSSKVFFPGAWRH